MSTTIPSHHQHLAPIMDYVLMGLAQDPCRVFNSAVRRIGMEALPWFFEQIQMHDGRTLLVRLAFDPAIPAFLRQELNAFLKHTLH